MRDKLLVCVFGLKQPECHLRDYRDLFSGEGGGGGGNERITPTTAQNHVFNIRAVCLRDGPRWTPPPPGRKTSSSPGPCLKTRREREELREL